MLQNVVQICTTFCNDKNNIILKNMQTYSQQMGNLLKRDVLNEEYRQITLETSQEDLKFDKLRGSTRMLDRNVKTEKDFDLFFDKVQNIPLP